MGEINEPQIKTLCKLNTNYCADSVEWCPHEPYQFYFTCSTYELKPACEGVAEKRLGSIYLFSLENSANLKLHQQQNFNEGILDSKWCPNRVNDNILLGIVTSNKKLGIYILRNNILELLTTHTFSNDSKSEVLILSLDWSTSKYESNQPFITCSDSLGKIHLLQLLDDKLTLLKSWNGHKFEAWIAAFYYWNLNVIFSGGDDNLFLMYDKRQENPILKKNRHHESGVTSIHCNKSREHIVCSSSFDDNVRIWDIRNFSKPANTLSIESPWRLKWDPFNQSNILAACMRNDAHILHLSNSNQLTIVRSYKEHDNLVYGVDWSHNLDKNGNVYIASCSFYDHLLCISTTNFNEIK